MREPLAPLTRDRFLEDLAHGLDLPPDAAQDALAELAGHLDDARSELETRGWAPDQAESEALRRLGDGRELGRELSKASRDRRRLLAAAGVGAWWAIREGIRGWLALSLMWVVTLAATLPLVLGIQHVFGNSSGGVLSGLSDSVFIVLLGWPVAAYLGWLIPSQVARAAGRSARGVRRQVAVIGFALGSLAVWRVLVLDLDRVVAVGLPLVPVSFAAAAWVAPERPTVRLGFVPAIVAGLLLVLPLTAWAVVTTESTSSSIMLVDSPAVGVPLPADAVLSDVGAACDSSCVAEVTADPAQGPVPWTSVQVELWPMSRVGDELRFGAAPAWVGQPVAMTSNENGVGAFVRFDPRLRDTSSLAAVLIGFRADGTRYVLYEDPSVRLPAWRGTLLDWWRGVLAGTP